VDWLTRVEAQCHHLGIRFEALEMNILGRTFPFGWCGGRQTPPKCPHDVVDTKQKRYKPLLVLTLHSKGQCLPPTRDVSKTEFVKNAPDIFEGTVWST
jgi:hypothetical protein